MVTLSGIVTFTAAGLPVTTTRAGLSVERNVSTSAVGRPGRIRLSSAEQPVMSSGVAVVPRKKLNVSAQPPLLATCHCLLRVAVAMGAPLVEVGGGEAGEVGAE